MTLSAPLVKLCPQSLPKHINRLIWSSARIKVPIGPAIACSCTLNGRTHLVDGAPVIALSATNNQAAVGMDARSRTAGSVGQYIAHIQQAALDDPAEGNAFFGALGGCLRHFVIIGGCNLADTVLGDLGVSRVLLNADPVAMEALGDRARRTGAEEWVQNYVTGLG